MFSKLVLGGSNKNLLDTLAPSLTDRGLCYTMNSKSVKKTYNANNKRVKSFVEIFDTDVTNDAPSRVNGSGYLHRSTFWLNVRNLSSRGFSKGSMTAAINNWNEYFSVRWEDTTVNTSLAFLYIFFQIKRNKNPRWAILLPEDHTTSANRNTEFQ